MDCSLPGSSVHVVTVLDVTEGWSTAHNMFIMGIWLLYDVSTWLGYITQLLNQILIGVLLWKCLVDVVP